MPTPRDSAFQALSQAGDGPSMPRSAAEPKGARHARGLDGAAPVWPPRGTIHRHQQKHQRFSGLNAVGAKVPPACHPLPPNKIKRLRSRQPSVAPSQTPLVPGFSMCRQPLSHIRVAVLLSCPPKVPMPPRTISRAHLLPTDAIRAADSANPYQKTSGQRADSAPDSRRRTRKNHALERRFRC